MTAAPKNGNILNKDGEIALNLADVIGGEPTGNTYNMSRIEPMSGLWLNSKGEEVDMTEALLNFLAGGGSGGGGTVTLQALQITVDDTVYTYDGKKAVTIPIKTGAAKEPLKIMIGDESFTYTGEEAVSITLPAVKENKTLTINLNGETFTYDGTADVEITVKAAEGVEF